MGFPKSRDTILGSPEFGKLPYMRVYTYIYICTHNICVGACRKHGPLLTLHFQGRIAQGPQKGATVSSTLPHIYIYTCTPTSMQPYMFALDKRCRRHTALNEQQSPPLLPALLCLKQIPHGYWFWSKLRLVSDTPISMRGPLSFFLVRHHLYKQRFQFTKGHSQKRDP